MMLLANGVKVNPIRRPGSLMRVGSIIAVTIGRPNDEDFE